MLFALVVILPRDAEVITHEPPAPMANAGGEQLTPAYLRISLIDDPFVPTTKLGPVPTFLT